MNAAVDYLHQHGATYPPEVLLAELRRAGYDEPSISAAWHHATAAPPTPQFAAPHPAYAAPTHHPAAMQQRLHTEHAVSLDSRRQSTPLLIGIVVALAALAGLGIFAWQNSDDTSSKADTVDARLDRLDDKTKAVVDSLGGATASEPLPAGWREQRTGFWVDERTGSNVSVIVSAVPPSDTLEDFAQAARAQLAKLGVKGLGTPEEGMLFDRPSLTFTGTLKGVELRQEYALVGDKVAVVTVSTPTSSDSAEAYSVADSLEPTA